MAEFILDASELKERAKELHAGDRVILSGVVYTSRDAAHKRIVKLIEEGGELPFDLDGACIYYAGPTQTPPGRAIGACGPTTSGRMDFFAPRLLDLGLSCMIGKGERSQAVKDAICRNQAVYLCAIGGAGALACKCIKSCEVIAFGELGCESVKRLTLENFPLIVAADAAGGDIFRDGQSAFAAARREKAVR